MREAVLAEWILSLVIAPDRAAAAIGDLQEERPERGRAWFWRSVLGTAASHVWQDLRLNPGWAIRRGLWGFAAEFACFVFLFVAIFIAAVCGHWYVQGQPVSDPRWLRPVFPILFVCVVPLWIGWRNARRSPQHELASAAATIVMQLSISLLAACAWAIYMWQLGDIFTALGPSDLASAVCTVLGAALQRRREMRKSSGVSHA